MEHYTGSVIESQPDWLTVSAHGEARAKLLLDLGVRLLEEEKAHGNRPRKWRSMGYDGLACGRVTYGQRDRAATELRLSGDAAHANLDVSTALADAVTRLDLAVTWRSDRPAPDLADAAAHDALEFKKHRTRAARPWAIIGTEGVETLYLGERASEYFFRLYNKEAQERRQMGADYDGRYDRCWRFELELKASVPALVLKKLLPERDRAQWIIDYLHTYSLAHGLTPPFEPGGELALIPGFRRQSDADSKLRHLSKNVRPTVQWLDAEGRDDDLRVALGLRPPGATINQLASILARHSATLPGVRAREGGKND